jgi:protein gp37/DNA-binding XRE family transcriptional regulator
MANDTSIEWTDATWNPVRGCSRVSEGCRNCYAEKVAARFSGPGLAYEGLARLKPIRFSNPMGPGMLERTEARWTGEVRMVPEHLADPLRWTKPRRVFVNSMSDLFHEKLADEDIDRIWATMLLAPRHTFQVLTKRAERARAYLTAPDLYARVLRAAGEIRATRPELAQVGISDPGRFPASWIHLGVSVEDQETADERIPRLLATPAAVRFVSYEPALGPVDFWPFFVDWDPDGQPDKMHGRLGWIIVGGESGPGARPFDIAWARSTVEQCRAANVACFVKQLGARPFERRAHGAHFHDDDLGIRSKKGGDMAEWPEDLRVREMPRPWPPGARAARRSARGPGWRGRRSLPTPCCAREGAGSRGREAVTPDEKTIAAAIGNRLKAARMKAGLSQRALSKRTGHADSFVAHIEAGRRLPSVGALYLFARELRIQATDLLPEIRPARALWVMDGTP